jgi:hypothetical protein
MSGKKKNTPIQSTMEGVFSGTRLVGTSISSTRAGPDQRIPKDQTFWKEKRHHQLRFGLGDHDKTKTAAATSGLLIPDQGKTTSIEHQVEKR